MIAYADRYTVFPHLLYTLHTFSCNTVNLQESSQFIIEPLNDLFVLSRKSLQLDILLSNLHTEE